MTTTDDALFTDEDDTDVDRPAVSADAGAVGRSLTAVEYAAAANPSEGWESCCVCGEAEGPSYMPELSRGLVLLADGTLARTAWCFRFKCVEDKYGSLWIPINTTEE